MTGMREGEATPGPAHELALPSRTDLTLIAIAVTAVSTSGPLIVATAAPALALAFWRNGLGAVAMMSVAVTRHRSELRGLSRREWRLIVIAGTLLAAHFATWIPSLRYTSVASSTALVASQPVWAALLARTQGAMIRRSAWSGSSSPCSRPPC